MLAADVFGMIEPVDFLMVPNLASLHPALTPERCERRMQLLEPDGQLSEGFEAARRLSRRLPLLMWLAPVLHLPGMRWAGSRVYDGVAAQRHRLGCALAQDSAGTSTSPGMGTGKASSNA